MDKNKSIPPIIQIGAWFLALFVFAVGFWHTHLGLKEMKPFGSEWGGIVIAGIVLLLLLITYWFAVNGNKIALYFYLLCGFVFFVCNLNYFYPSYMARTIVKEEADTLIRIIDDYSSSTIFKNDFYTKVSGLELNRDDYVKQVRDNHGEGIKAKAALRSFNDVLITSGLPSVSEMRGGLLSENEIIAQEKALNSSIEAFGKNNIVDGIVALGNVLAGYNKLNKLKNDVVPKLREVVSDDSSLKLDSIKFHPQVILIKNTVSDINSAVTPFNKGSGNESLKILDKEKFPRSDKLGEIQNTFITIKERLNQVSTWAIIFLCLFIDFVVPLAIYILLRNRNADSVVFWPFDKAKPQKF